eukprot:5646339-Prymnesium_polylepis.1
MCSIFLSFSVIVSTPARSVVGTVTFASVVDSAAASMLRKGTASSHKLSSTSGSLCTACAGGARCGPA